MCIRDSRCATFLLSRPWIPISLRSRLQYQYSANRILRRPPGLLIDQGAYRDSLQLIKKKLPQTIRNYAEFGVSAGDSLVVAVTEFPQARFWAFDSFQGLPKGSDAEHGDWYEGQFICPLPVTIANMQRQDICLLYTSPSPRDRQKSRMPSSA